MKKIIVLLFVLSILCMAAADVEAAGGAQPVTGATIIGASGSPGSTLSVQTSNNVYMAYDGVSQTYGVFAKNKAGDKIYATGGGQGASTNIYYQQNNNNIGVSTLGDPSSMWVADSIWTAQ